MTLRFFSQLILTLLLLNSPFNLQASAGDFDPKVVSSGYLKINTSLKPTHITALAIDSIDRIVAIGSKHNFNRDIVILRYYPNGILDQSFGTDGQLEIDLPHHCDDIANHVIIDKSDNIIVTGTTCTANSNNNQVFAFRLKGQNGQFDPMYGTRDGIIIQDLTPTQNLTITSATLDPDERLIVAGYTMDISGSEQGLLARYTKDGKQDQKFANHGIKIFDSSAKSTRFNAVTVDKTGAIYVAGQESHDFLIYKLNVNGALDTRFGKQGQLLLDIFKGHDEIKSIAINAQGHLIVAGTSDLNIPTGKDIALAAFTQIGQPVLNFGTEGITAHDLNLSFENITGMLIDTHQNVLVIGNTTGLSEDRLPYHKLFISRFLGSNGQIDLGFANQGTQYFESRPGDDQLTSLVNFYDETVLIGGGLEYDMSLIFIQNTISAASTPDTSL